uniref:Protein phosphatase 1 regulatory inhibitor subunit 1C n=1 Tax=Vombatus ursinus TaxID=29139 RepID=A0A4X2LSJ1_VOMUR
MEPNSPKKIQFAVPLFQSQIAPEAAEQIRKRRPTPASLVILNEHNSPEIDEKRVTNSQGESQNASPKQRKQSVYTPPAMKGTVQVLFPVVLTCEAVDTGSIVAAFKTAAITK